MSNLDFSTLSSLIHRILGAYSVAQLGSIATIFGITCYTFATKSRDRAREVGILGFLAMLPFGYKPIFLYCLLLVFFVAFFEGGVASSHVQPPQEVDGSSPHALSSQHVPEGKDIMIPIGRSDWSVNVRFQSSSSPHVSFPSYNFDIKTIDKNLDPNTRLGEVAFNYKRVPTLDSDSVVDGGAKFEPLGVQLEIVHRMHRSTTFYQLSLVKRNFMLSAEQIPRKLRKGGAGGQGWKIDCPGFKTFHKTIGDKVVPATVLCPYGLSELSDYSEYHTDIAQVPIPIIIPILKSLTFVGDPFYGGVYDSPFRDRTRKFSWGHLKHLELDHISIFPEEYQGILEVCKGLSSMILHRPGEGDGTPGLSPLTSIVTHTNLRTLRLLECRTPIHGFLSSTRVCLTVSELVLQTDITQNTLQANHLGIQWGAILEMKLSERLGGIFIGQCRMNLPAGSRLEVIPN